MSDLTEAQSMALKIAQIIRDQAGRGKMAGGAQFELTATILQRIASDIEELAKPR